MSNRIRSVFENGKAFLPFITCGDPSLEATEEMVYAMAEAQADLIVLGIPFSEPTAEGPVIQAANARALTGGATTDGIFAMVERIRRHTVIPLAFMTYANVVFSYRQKGAGEEQPGGIRAFIRRAAGAGVDALILPDVPFEEREEFALPCRENGIAFILQAAPAPGERISGIVQAAEGFVYCVPAPGVRRTEGMEVLVRQIRQEREIPCVIDTGSFPRSEADSLARLADGVMAGTGVVELCQRYGKGSASHVRDYVRRKKEAIGIL